ncbi:imidazolonepropionase [Moritella sp. F3]|uniref:imidazolonepropionase n=1 Tax=Moritella sp. F3 TaxID=2718882 RepID=UPI0018E129E8|nr:imidazolonepropionase [Moritella sp. F3]GIC76726.1 imidazolonepropionase [Moritella sp. F1]GIC80258.1 imidazolonepropionase [Moritella sp. F3]
MSLLLTNTTIVSMDQSDSDYQTQPHCYIAMAHGKIVEIGAMQQCPTTTFTDVIDCQGRLITPGLIDSHTHLVFAGNRAKEFEQRLTGVPYETIAKQGGGILSTVNATRAATEVELVELALKRLSALTADGVTTIEIKSGYGLTLEDELKMLRAAKQLELHANIKVSTTLLAAHAVPPEYKGNADSYIRYVCDMIIPAAVAAKLVDSVDVFCEGIGFNLAQTKAVFEAALSHGLGIKGHTEQLSNLGGSELAAKMGATSVDHIEYLDEQGVKALAEHGTVATLLPGAFYFLRETQLPPIELLRQHNVPMALATDFNPGTSPIASLTMMMNMGCTLFRLTPEEALRGVTCHAARALGLQDARGQIKVGYDADLAIWDIDHPAQLAYEVGTPRLHARILNGALCHD